MNAIVSRIARWRLVPRTLFGRLTLVGLGCFAALAALSCFELHLRPDNVYWRAAMGIEARFLSLFIRPILAVEGEPREELVTRLNQDASLILTLSSAPLPLQGPQTPLAEGLVAMLRDFALSEGLEFGNIQASMVLWSTPPADPDEVTSGAGAPPQRGRRASNAARAEAVLELPDGQWLRVVHHIEKIPDRYGRPIEYIARLPLESLVVIILALAAGFWIARPLRDLARAIDTLGRDLDAPPLPERSGLLEIRETARAFNTMRTRLQDYLRQRAFMFAAISHDLRTPLTRLRLRLEAVPDPDLRASMDKELCEIQDMLDEVVRTVRLAQLDDASEAPDRVEIMALLESLVDDYRDLGHEVLLSGEVPGVFRLKPRTLRRCLDNLVSNAVRYGEHVTLQIRRDGPRLRVDVLDDGPGIPEAEQKNVFEPFYRLDRSRNRCTGGHGLGLAIARTFARRCGGEVLLSNRPEGGLCASVQLPLEKA